MPAEWPVYVGKFSQDFNNGGVESFRLPNQIQVHSRYIIKGINSKMKIISRFIYQISKVILQKMLSARIIFFHMKDIVHDAFASLKTFLHHMTSYLKKSIYFRQPLRQSGWKKSWQKTIVFFCMSSVLEFSHTFEASGICEKFVFLSHVLYQ